MSIKQTIVAALGLIMAAQGASAAETTYMGNKTGYWDNPTNWDLANAPTNNTDAKIIIQAGKTMTLTNSATINRLALGSNLNTGDVVIDGGALLADEPTWNAIGYANSANLTIKNAGTMTILGRLDVGLNDAVVGQVNTFTMTKTSGNVSVAGVFNIGGPNFDGSHAATAKAYIQGGTLTVGSLKIDPDGDTLVDISGSGKLVINGNVTNTLAGYVANGVLLGNSAVSNVLMVVNISVGATNTTVTAMTPAIPSYTGMMLATATNEVVADGFAIGTISNGYVRGVTGGTVLDQDPAAGTLNLPAGTPINLVIQEIPPTTQVNISWLGAGVWTNGARWSTGVAPMRETQNIKATVSNPGECVLDTAAGVAHFVISGGNVRLVSGADLYCGKEPAGTEWTAVGYNNPSTLVVESNAVFETAKNLLVGFTTLAGENKIDLKGGVMKVGTSLDLGEPTGASWGVVTITSNGVLSASSLSFKNTNTVSGTDSVINIVDGTLKIAGVATNAVTHYIDSAKIVIGGTDYTLAYTNGMTVLDVFSPVSLGYSGWASGWGVDIGVETGDYDNDGLLNVHEYGLGGDPTNSASLGYEPTYGSVADGGTNWFQFVHVKLTDENSGITYLVEATDNLVFPSWTNPNVVIVGSGPFAPGFETVTNRVPTAGKANQFMRLIIE